MDSKMFEFAAVIKRVAVIGAGPCGLALAKTLLAEKTFDKVQVFERQAQAGGVWNYTGSSQIPQEISELIPSVDPYAKEPLVLRNGKPLYFSPMYKSLETNIPKNVMAYNNTPFDEKLETFPSRQEVLSYVQAYGESVKDVIKFNAYVTSVEKIADKWEITYTDYNTPNNIITDNNTTPTSISKSEFFDAVVICTGHYDLPHIPQVKGITEWTAKYPGTIIHSKYYNDPTDYAGKTVLVVGNSASGLDVSMQVADYATKVYRSISTASRMPFAEDPRVTDIPIITEYDAENQEIRLQDGSVLSKNIDAIIYCTGYLYSFPYLKSYMDPQEPDSLITKGNRLNRMYKQIFYIPDPTLSLIVMTKFTVPFPLAEAQGSIVARVYSGRLSLPSLEAMRVDEHEEETAKGTGAEFHALTFPADVEYIRFLREWMDSAKGEGEQPGVGFQPEVWDDAKYQTREQAYALKKARLENKLRHAIKEKK